MRKLQTNLDRIKFQFTPLREGRLVRRVILRPAADFNSRPSARGDMHADNAEFRAFVFQFTPLREGRLQAYSMIETGKRISIHAPPRGATQLYT